MFLRGFRHGFARRHGRPLQHDASRVAVWVCAIVALVGFETYQFVRGAPTATSLMSPVLHVTVVRVAAFAWWALLGLELTRA